MKKTEDFTTTEFTEIIEEEKTDSLTRTIIGAAIEVHRSLGPGLLEQQLEAQSRPFRDELAELSIQAAEAKPGSLLSGESPSFRREFFNRHMKPV